ncbi:MAG: C-GCAxxG-C-C family (seleno)protein [Christensenellales bacterium]|nr:C-GCAxxG-C-C family (seleno)protein [Christensenellales bacterium]
MAEQKSRREFLRMAGKGVLGAAALGAIPSVLQPAAAEAVEVPEHPWEYKQIDKDVVRQHTYDTFYTHGGCCAAVASGILETMAAEYGAPYNYIPTKLFATGEAGYGAGSLCGSLGGACGVLGLFANAQEARAMRNELFDWYRTTAFPIFQPEYESITTVANSVNCVDSVGIYMEATGYDMSDPERMARCAGLSADVAAKTVELLNIHFGFEPAPMVEEAPAAEETLAENEYIGVGEGFGGEVKVKVTMDGDKIAKIEVLSHSETAGISDPAFTQIPEAIIAANSTEVDVVTGATRTSDALIAAVNDALSQVK